METWLWLLLASVVGLLLAVVVARWLLRRIARPPKDLVGRLERLTWRERILLALGLMRDERLPIGIRVLIPAVVLYLVLPFDIIPDFIPFIGALDDVLVILIAIRLLLRAIPSSVLDDHFERLDSGRAARFKQLDDGSIVIDP